MSRLDAIEQDALQLPLDLANALTVLAFELELSGGTPTEDWIRALAEAQRESVQ